MTGVLIEELVAYLFKGNVTDKRKAVDELLESTLEVAKVERVREEFKSILATLCVLNDIKPLNETRFKQRNDFYTLFCFIAKHTELPLVVLKEQYKFSFNLIHNCSSFLPLSHNLYLIPKE